MKQLLLVYHQPLFCRAFGEAIAKKSDKVLISFVTDAKTALKHLNLRPTDVMLTDTRLPVVDGLQLLSRVQQKFPYVIRAVMATEVNEEERKQASEYGALVYFEKPASPSDYDAAVERVMEILRSLPDTPRGELDAAELNHVIGQDVEAGKNMTVNIYMGFDRGQMIFKDRKLVHAETQGLKGKEALREILSWHDGAYEKRGEMTGQKQTHTLDMSWEEVFTEWKKDLKKRPSVNTTVVNREFRTFVTGEAPPMPATPAEEKKASKPIAKISRVAPKVTFSEKLVHDTGVQCGLQMDAQGNIDHEFHCPDPTLMRGVASFTIAKARELAGAFQWEMPLSIHYISPSMNLVVLPYKEKTVLLGWASRTEGVLEKLVPVFGADSLDPVDTGKHPAATMDGMKKIPGLHGYAIFRKPVHLLVKKFSTDWTFEMLETTARIASQMCTVLRLQGMPLQLIQVKFKVGSVLAKPADALSLIVISHSQTKVPLLKDCMLRISPSELNKAAR